MLGSSNGDRFPWKSGQTCKSLVSSCILVNPFEEAIVANSPFKYGWGCWSPAAFNTLGNAGWFLMIKSRRMPDILWPAEWTNKSGKIAPLNGPQAPFAQMGRSKILMWPVEVPQIKAEIFLNTVSGKKHIQRAYPFVTCSSLAPHWNCYFWAPHNQTSSILQHMHHPVMLLPRFPAKVQVLLQHQPTTRFQLVFLVRWYFSHLFSENHLHANLPIQLTRRTRSTNRSPKHRN